MSKHRKSISPEEVASMIKEAMERPGLREVEELQRVVSHAGAVLEEYEHLVSPPPRVRIVCDTAQALA